MLHALPWIGGELAEKKPEELKNLLDAIQRVLARREKLHVQLLRVWSTDKPHAQLDSLDSLAMQVDKLREDDWHEGHISRHYVAFDAQLCQALQHNLPRCAFVVCAMREEESGRKTGEVLVWWIRCSRARMSDSG